MNLLLIEPDEIESDCSLATFAFKAFQSVALTAPTVLRSAVSSMDKTVSKRMPVFAMGFGCNAAPKAIL